MAAGMGSRYGGLKQTDGVGLSGETLMEYSIYDALRAGFGEVVFIIRRDMYPGFKKSVMNRISIHIPVRAVFQDINDLPESTGGNCRRTKPWGTAHAVWTARKAVTGPFLVVNADDFYGRESFQKAGEFLYSNREQDMACLVGYEVKNTLSAHGAVTRAICEADEGHLLRNIIELHRIRKENGTILYCTGKKDRQLEPDTTVSMNMWGFMPRIFSRLGEKFRDFLENHDPGKQEEFLIPSAINELIHAGELQVRVLDTPASWIGMTHKEDREAVRRKLAAMVARGEYPKNLWA